MKYPFNFDIPKIMTFRDRNNNIACLVARADDFNENELIKYLVDSGLKNKLNIEEAYARHYMTLPKKSECCCITGENEGYALCKAGRGAFKVFVVKGR